MGSIANGRLLAIDNAASAAPPMKMPTTKPFPKNAAVELVALELADGLYPIVQGLQGKPVAALAGKVVSLAASGDPKEISACCATRPCVEPPSLRAR